MPCCFLRSPEQFLQLLLCLPFAVAVEIGRMGGRLCRDTDRLSAVTAVTVDDDTAEVDVLHRTVLYGFFRCLDRQVTVHRIIFLFLCFRQLRDIRMGFPRDIEDAVITAPVFLPPGVSAQACRMNLIIVRIFLLHVIFKRGANITIGT